MASWAKRRKTLDSRSNVSDPSSPQKPGVRNVVPWSNFDEWLDVRRKILDGSEENTKSALSRLQVWQLRCDSKKCPSFVEATVHLLRAFVADKENADTSAVLSVYGEAINKFVQTILERSGKQGEAIANKNMAESLQIPQWIVDVRNDAIHHFRGSLPLYRTTANTVFAWLKRNYWAEDKRETVPEDRTTVSVADNSLQEYIQLALSAKSQTERSHAEAVLSTLRSNFALADTPSLIAQLIELELMTSIDGGRSAGTIPQNYKNAYLPIFAMLGSHLTTLFTGVLKTLSLPAVVCTNRDIDQSMEIIVRWVEWLASGAAVWNGIDLASNLNLKKILQAASIVISNSTMRLLDICLDKMEPPLSEEKSDFVRKVYVAFSGERAKTCDGTNGFEKMAISTVEHVVAERANREKLNRQQLPSTPRIDWSVVPLGLLPDTVTVGDLHLDVDIEKDYVPFNVETEDEAVMKYERKFQEEQKQNQEIKSYDESLYELQRRVLSACAFKLWRIPNSNTAADEGHEYEEYTQCA